MLLQHDLFTGRGINLMQTQLASGWGGPHLSDLYPSTTPAWVTLPGAYAPAGIALLIIAVLKPSHHDKVWTMRWTNNLCWWKNELMWHLIYSFSREKKFKNHRSGILFSWVNKKLFLQSLVAPTRCWFWSNITFVLIATTHYPGPRLFSWFFFLPRSSEYKLRLVFTASITLACITWQNSPTGGSDKRAKNCL